MTFTVKSRVGKKFKEPQVELLKDDEVFALMQADRACEYGMEILKAAEDAKSVAAIARLLESYQFAQEQISEFVTEFRKRREYK